MYSGFYEVKAQWNKVITNDTSALKYKTNWFTQETGSSY